MQALVTGGSGFIGSELIRQLLDHGCQVRVLLRKTSPRANLEGLNYEAALGDLNDLESLKQAVRGVDYVFHLAGSISAKNREEYFRHNAEGTGNLARACAEANSKLKRFIYVSSLAASGPSGSIKPRQEDESEAPISDYGQSKLGGEQKLEYWARGGSEQGDILFPFTIVRPPAVYGPRDRGIFEFIKLVNSGIAPVFPSASEDGEKYFSVIHVDDLVGGIVLAGLAHNQGKKEVFFLSGDGLHSWSQVMSSMAEALGKKPVRIPLPKVALTGIAVVYSALGAVLKRQFPLTLDKLKELKPDYWICSNERAKKVLKFQPKWDLKNGMANTVAWYKENGWV